MTVLLVLDVSQDFSDGVGADYVVVMMMMEHRLSIFSVDGLTKEILLH